MKPYRRGFSFLMRSARQHHQPPTEEMSEPTTTQNLEVAPPHQTSKTPVLVGKSGIVISDIDSLWRFSTAVQKSGLAPKGIQSAEAIFVAIQMGLEVGLTPMAALQNIAVINGRPSIWGDAQLAVVRGTGEMEVFEEWFEAGGLRIARNPTSYTDDTCAVCRVKRRGFEETEISFSVADAKLANLWGKEGPWRQYPWRMLRMRARSFALRDQFGDALRGMRSVEENQDTPAIEVTPQVEVRVAPVEVRQIATAKVEQISGAQTPALNSPEGASPQTGGERVTTTTEGGNGAAEPQAKTKAPPAPPSNSRVANFRRFLSESGIPEKAAMDQIHKMFPETDSLGTLEDVEAMAPNVVNAILRGKPSFVSAVQASAKDGSLAI